MNESREGGYAVELNPTTRGVEVRVWGFWTRETAAAFDGAVVSQLRDASTIVTIDAREFPAQREDGQSAFARLFEAFRVRNVRAKVMTQSPLTKLQLARIVKEKNLGVLIDFM